MGYFGKVEITGVNTTKLTVLTREEAAGLFKKAKTGDMEARQKLINGNLRLVLSIIKRFDNRSESIDDLFQVGCIGLIKGIDNFDTSLNVLPSTYLVPMIIGEIRRYLRDNNFIRVSRSLRDTAYKALQVRDQLASANSKEPTIEEIAKILEKSPEEVAEALEAIQEPVSLFEPVYHNDGDTLYVMDQMSDDKESDSMWLDNISINEAINKLTEREKKILMLRFFDGKTQMEVSDEVGISQAQVSRLEKSALKHMKKYV
ncbi:MAG: RNA polymerase sporulation sigma factor SigG [Candidatus Metalachnospira sp.]|nr:RNA polymerase sporulation sigma factor SigG [Candidatus Metalachnospira sp.]